jgi:ubiquinone/menaquinone biosynthesis C-methylase UbiE
MVDSALERIPSLQRERPSLLHLGCGVGAKTEALRRLGYNVTGVDLNDKHLQRAKISFPQISFVRGDIQALPFQQGSFDIVFSFSTLQLVSDKQRVIEESARVLGARGWAVFIENLTGNPIARGYRAMHSALGFRYPALETPKTYLHLSEIERFERCFSHVETSVFHLTTPITLVIPAAMALFLKSPMSVQSELLYRMLARVDRFMLNYFRFARQFAWHVVATMSQPFDRT